MTTPSIARIACCLALVAHALPQHLLAQDNSPTPPQRVAIPDTEVHALYSETIGDDFELWIARPQAGFVPMPEGPVRVLYVLDANLFFGTAVEMTRLMYKLYGELPPLLVVGIAYPTENGMLQGLLRTRDFTPSKDASMAAMAGAFPQPAGAEAINPKMGGAAAFLDFLQTEVKPFVQAHYHVREDGAILFGSSLGGLFVTHALLSAPTSFDNFIAVSPALWWNQSEIFSHTPDWSVVNSHPQTKVFIAAGSLEENPDVPALANFKLITNARRMATTLQENAPTSVKVYFQEMADETHTSVVPVALTRALRQILQRVPLTAR